MILVFKLFFTFIYSLTYLFIFSLRVLVDILFIGITLIFATFLNVGVMSNDFYRHI